LCQRIAHLFSLSLSLYLSFSFFFLLLFFFPVTQAFLSHCQDRRTARLEAVSGTAEVGPAHEKEVQGDNQVKARGQARFVGADGSVGLRAVQVVEAMYRSASSGQVAAVL